MHRDMMSFRRLSYGNATHLNISVHVGEDNKAQIYSALDRSDKNYYACDAGCLDPPVKLINSLLPFPVKKTDPRTAVLYITADKQVGVLSSSEFVYVLCLKSTSPRSEWVCFCLRLNVLCCCSITD